METVKKWSFSGDALFPKKDSAHDAKSEHPLVELNNFVNN